MDLIEIVGIDRGEWPGLGLPRRVQAVLAPLKEGVRRCRVAFVDDNGPKGGVAMRCAIDVRIARRSEIHIEGRATSARLALHAALERLERRIGRTLGARRVASRHPKKYYAAARTLAAAPPAGARA